GLAGLAAARTLAAAGDDVVVLERADAVGGRIRTLRRDGAAVDVGAQFVAPFCDRVLAAACEVGLGDDLPLTQLRGAVVDGRGSHPLSLATLLSSGLLPVADRLRLVRLALPVLRHAALLDPHDLSRARPLDAASVERLVRGRAGDRAAEALVGPLLQGLLYWDLPTTSQAMLLVMLRVAWRARTVHHPAGGLDRLTTALAATLDVRVGDGVTTIRPDGARWRLVLGRDGDVVADAVVVATTATAAADLLGVAPLVGRALRTVTYSRTTVVVCRVAAEHVPASTLMFRLGWAPDLAAVTVVDGAGPTRLVRVFLSDRGARATADHDDDAVARVALDAVRRAGVRLAGARPVAVQRWTEALPRFEVGSLRRRPIPAWAPSALPGVVLAGDYLGGPYLEGAWRSGEAAARLLGRPAARSLG
ncbi:FAD-dependent oxidoreductase, partial [Actinotalea ferrariae]|uniref:FAD-dependent oxidoreductase n=1 Tax=Actinotalea ferrariae TaxID=1386098 RepID=UPI001C8C7645